MNKKQKKVQLILKGELLEDFLSYKAKEQINTNSDAARNLVELALRILKNHNDDGISNRDLLELILLQVNKGVGISKKIMGSTIDIKHEQMNKDLFHKVDEAITKVTKNRTNEMLSN